eukprot:TRINITY_DN4027_c0_g1_i1.p1 TRINITY_DN4027_c0_g1~~TRINITY_DN4027_c0_g1_i1.p1  ORF type:complete len:460 (-),score=38.64 TRINITY_DN4027_c0_g1_i1:23-1402(-)
MVCFNAHKLGILFLLTSLGAPAFGDIFLSNQTDSKGSSVVLSDYVHAKFGPYNFPPIVDAPLWEIPRDCALHTRNVSLPARFIAVWQRSGACPFETLSLFWQEKGAVALIIVNWDNPVESPRGFFTSSNASSVRIPVLEISKYFGEAFLVSRSGELANLTSLVPDGKRVIEAFDFLVLWGVIFQVFGFAVSLILTVWMFLRGIQERNIKITYWINFFFFLANMARSSIDPFWTMNYVPAVLGAFLYGNPNNFVVGSLFWFAYIFLDLVGKGNLNSSIIKAARYLIFLQVFLVVAGEIICLALVGGDLHELAWRFFPLWAGSILIIPMAFYSVVLFRLHRDIMKTVTLTNAHSSANKKSINLARRIKLLGLFQAPLLVASFAMVALRGIVPVLFGWVWSGWIWHLFVQMSGLLFHSLAYGFWLAKLRGWKSPFEKRDSSRSTRSTEMQTSSASSGSGPKS